MTDRLRVDRRGFVFYQGVRLPIRYEARSLEFVIKHPADRRRLKCKRLSVPLDEFQMLERRRVESFGAQERRTGDDNPA
ncbi:MAG: hypothetical protein GY832_26335 [Chloroflexi bacterium]|nr:hypothetical protein [Chloroflexota bacterium]